MITSCKIWGLTDIPWDNSDWKWSECPVVTIGNLSGVDAETLIQPWMREEPWNPYKTGSLENKKLIRLMCKYKDQSYNEEKKTGDYTLSVKDIRMVIKPLLDINFNLKMEK